MVALTGPRPTLARDGNTVGHPVKGVTTIYQGSLVALDAAGWLVPASSVATLIVVGRAKQGVVNAGANGAETVEVERGTFRWANSAAADAIARTEIGKDVFAVDDQTVAKTNGGGTRSIAGKVVDVDAQGVWVRTSF